VPAERPHTFVAIDWAFGGVAPSGGDLGELLIGLTHAGELGTGELVEQREIVATAYAAAR